MARTIPTTTWTWRTPVQTIDWITWNESADTWASVTETWDTYYSWIVDWTAWS